LIQLVVWRRVEDAEEAETALRGRHFRPLPKTFCIDFRNDLNGLARWYDLATIGRIL
jgi:hypothetical protein